MLERLTSAEQKVIVLVAQGLKNREIAQSLFISESTVKTYLQSIFIKFGVTNRVSASIYALKNGIIE